MIKRIKKQTKTVALSNGFKPQSAQVTVGLLRDWVILTLNWAWEGGVVQEVLTVVPGMLVTLTKCDLEEEDYHPYDGSDRPQGPLDPSVAANGLGEAGVVPVPCDIWNKHAPTGLKWALDELPHQGETRDQGLAALAHKMCADSLIHRDCEGGKSCCGSPTPNSMLFSFECTIGMWGIHTTLNKAQIVRYYFKPLLELCFSDTTETEIRQCLRLRRRKIFIGHTFGHPGGQSPVVRMFSKRVHSLLRPGFGGLRLYVCA